MDENNETVKKKKGKGCLIVILIVVVIVLILIGIIVCSGGEASFSTANLNDTYMADQIDTDTFEPFAQKDTFSPSTTIIYVVTTLKNAPSDTEIKSEWWYLDTDYLIDTAAITSTKTNQAVYFDMTSPDKGWPLGDYEVKLFLDGKEVEIHKFYIR